MLIPSPRHTDTDLRVWAELEDADRAWGESRRVAWKAAGSMAAIHQFLREGPAYCGVSWGKDSVVLAEMACWVGSQHGLIAPLIWVRVDPVGNPDCPAVRDAFLSRWPHHPYHEIGVGHDGRGTGRLKKGFAEVGRRFGLRHLSGLRADESGGRKISMRHRGLVTEKSCRPLGWWTAADVFGFLAFHGLPVHPAYACLGGGRWLREHLRVATLGGERGSQFGRAEWEREYYGDYLNRLSCHDRNV